MRTLTLATVLVAFFTADPVVKYPKTEKLPVVDDYFGTKIADPYRWLEDDNSADTKAWVEAQNRVTFAYLDTIPERARIRARLSEVWDHERYGSLFKRGGRYFYEHNDGLQNQDVLHVADRLADAGRVLLDPNTLSADGTVALADYSVSEDGRRLAYALAEGGSDWVEWRVRDVDTGADLADLVKWSKFGRATWLKDGSGFIYSRYEAPAPGASLTAVNRTQRLYLHRVGQTQGQDTLVYERPDEPDWFLDAAITDDGRWLVITQAEGTDPKTRVFLKDLSSPSAAIVPFLDAFDATYTVVGNDGETFYVHTDSGAPRFKLVAIDRARPQAAAWRTIVPEAPGRDVMAGVSMIAGRFAVTWRVDALEQVKFHDLSGAPAGELPRPGIGQVLGISGRRGDREGFYAFESFTAPPVLYRYDFDTQRGDVFRQSRVKFRPEDFETRQVFYTSKDGTRVPMFLVHRKGLVLDGKRPTYLYGYGGFNIPMGPQFSAGLIAWLEMGGVFAQPGLRGGGEYGREWHDAGRRARKQNVFDDFIAAAEWLAANRYASPATLAIGGGSNGGLLVGAVMTQRPDLFAAALPAVGVMDMLRFHKFTVGWAWTSDYGSSETKDGFDVLIKYSPLHNIRAGVSYPATLVTTGDHDDRVVPAHSHKFIAALQAAQTGPAPVLTRIETRAGHGAGKPVAKQIDERADAWAFLVKNLRMRLPEGF